jgi:Obg family GTPase CgtA
MKFYDYVSISVESGKWWDGLATARREKYVAMWWPAWWDGWKWGSIWIEANPNEYTLMPFRYKKIYKAKPWDPGQTSDKYWKNADDVTVYVPLWTAIKETASWRLIGHVTKAWERLCIARWGKGWAGNIHFKNPKNQYPDFALLWEPWEKKEISLELLLLWDIALIWSPSVGKTTLINAISSVRAKTAAYHFTTLVPNIGVVTHKNQHFTVVDIPWLITGAHEGKWLWNTFLRHMLKARVRVVMCDMTRDIEWMEDISMIFNEIRQYIDQRYEKNTVHHVITVHDGAIIYQIKEKTTNEILLQKWILFVASKADHLAHDTELVKYYTQTLVEIIEKTILLKTSRHNTSTHEHDSIVPSHDTIEGNICVLSTFLPESIERFLNFLVTYLNTHTLSSYQEFFALTPPLPEGVRCQDTTKTELPYLLEEWYLNETQSKFIKVRTIYEPSISYLTAVTPWWNYEGELRYRSTMAKEWHIKWLETHGARKWDVLKVLSTYAWRDPQYILWE